MSEKMLSLFLSGGASNTDTNLSLGGTKSTASQIYGNTLSWNTTEISGVSLLDSLGAVVGGVGTLHFYFLTNEIAFQKLGGLVPAAGDRQDISLDGEYLITAPEGDMSIAISTIAASLPAVDTSKDIDNVKVNPNLFNHIPLNDELIKRPVYRHMYVKHTGTRNIKYGLYIKQNFQSRITLSFGRYNADSVNPNELLPDQYTTPKGIEFLAPTNISEAIILNLNVGGTNGYFLKIEPTIRVDSPIIETTTQLVIEEVI